MTKTAPQEHDVLSELSRAEAKEAQELAASRSRYWHAVIAVADPQAVRLTGEEIAKLSADLKALGLSSEEMRADVQQVRELHALAGGDTDLAVQARERAAKAKARAVEAARALAEAKLALQVAEREVGDASWSLNTATDGINEAAKVKRDTVRRAQDRWSALVERGAPMALLPTLPGGEREAPPELVPVRAVEKAYVAGRIVEVGDVVEVAKTKVGGALVEIGSEEDSPPEPAPPAAPPWTTAGFMAARGVTPPAIESTDKPAIPGPSREDCASMDRILTPTPPAPEEDA